MHHILSARQFNQGEIAQIFEHTDFLREEPREDLVRRQVGRVVATLFYEPSTRTRLSFESAAQRLGTAIISTENAGEFSSAVKGETLEDTIRTVAGYSDAIVMRHKKTGAADEAAAVSEVPIINAGDGQGEHPTQALLDLYTIQSELGRLDNLKVVIGGDLVKGRTARSLAKMLSLYPGNEITFVSLPELKIGDDITAHLDETGTSYHETDDMYPALHDADVVYWTRLQLERHDHSKSNQHKIGLEHNYVIDQAALQAMKTEAIIMHPLPRNNEIHTTVDSDPRAKYFNQTKNGLYVRTALLDMLLE